MKNMTPKVRMITFNTLPASLRKLQVAERMFFFEIFIVAIVFQILMAVPSFQSG